MEIALTQKPWLVGKRWAKPSRTSGLDQAHVLPRYEELCRGTLEEAHVYGNGNYTKARTASELA